MVFLTQVINPNHDLETVLELVYSLLHFSVDLKSFSRKSGMGLRQIRVVLTGVQTVLEYVFRCKH